MTRMPEICGWVVRKKDGDGVVGGRKLKRDGMMMTGDQLRVTLFVCLVNHWALWSDSMADRQSDIPKSRSV